MTLLLKNYLVKRVMNRDNLLSGIADKNAVAAIRVSTTKQSTDGDSPDAQKEQIERFAASRGIKILQYFIFLESASKELQPMQMAVDFCKNPKNNIQLFIVKSIDRFTRGGSYSYDQMKMQLDACKVCLLDIYGVIRGEEINTLEHLGFEYKWSKYFPSKKSEILEAERAKDEIRDILSRMIGAEIRYTQLGYWMHKPPYGFMSETVETKHGKRCILMPHQTESKYVIKMFELRAKGVMSDDQIVQKINSLGFRTRIQYVRDKNDRTNIINTKGGKPLNCKRMQTIIQKPIYVGINTEKWTRGKAIKCVFNGIVSVNLFNQANRGKKMIIKDSNNDFIIYEKDTTKCLFNKNIRISDYPYRKLITCPVCNNSLLGSASRGRLGKYYPAYHCSHRGHYFRIPKKELEDGLMTYVNNIFMPPEIIDKIVDIIGLEWNFRNQSRIQELLVIDNRIIELQKDLSNTLDKIRVVTTPTVIKLLEEDLIRIDQQIKELQTIKNQKELKNVCDINTVQSKARYYMKHLGELLKKQTDLNKKSRLSTLLFRGRPTAEDILLRACEKHTL